MTENIPGKEIDSPEHPGSDIPAAYERALAAPGTLDDRLPRQRTG